MIGFEYILLGIAMLVLLSIVIARATKNIGVPTLILFLAVGMLAGSDGPGGIHFSDTALAQSIGCIALMLILFSGGLDTDWKEVRPIVKQGISLATVGVLLTAILVGVFVSYLLGLPLLQGLLLGAIVSSTDAAAVFSVLRSKGVYLMKPLRPLLEFESGSNDPMAVFLTISMIQLITQPENSFGGLVVVFFLQMGIGALVGIILGKVMVWSINHLKLPYEGVYPVFTLAFISFVYSIAAVAWGSGFLAVYIAGIIVGNSRLVQKRSLVRFFDGFAWLSQICMFLALGLLVNPHELLTIVVPGILIGAFLILVARPISVFIGLSATRYGWKEKAFISWVRLRGAAPVILATFPLLAGTPHAQEMFNIVFFIVLTSALLQGWSMTYAARIFSVETEPDRNIRRHIEVPSLEGTDTELVDLIVPNKSAAAGKTIIEIGLPPESLIALIGRNEEFVVPSGSTVLEEGDTLLVVVKQKDLIEVKNILSTVNTRKE